MSEDNRRTTDADGDVGLWSFMEFRWVSGTSFSALNLTRAAWRRERSPTGVAETTSGHNLKPDAGKHQTYTGSHLVS